MKFKAAKNTETVIKYALGDITVHVHLLDGRFEKVWVSAHFYRKLSEIDKICELLQQLKEEYGGLK